MRILPLLLALSATAFAADPFLGKWKLNVAKSEFGVAPAMRSMEVEWTIANGQLAIHVRSEAASGRTADYQYTAAYDNAWHTPPAGPWPFDRVRNQQIDERTRQDFYEKDGKPTGRTVRRVSADGATLTYEGEFFGPDGQPTRNKLVFDRVR